MKTIIGLLAVLMVATLVWLPTASAAAPTDPPGGRHTIQRGETLASIAARYKVSVSALQNANGIRNANSIRAGATLIIPGSARSSLAAGSKAASKQAPSGPVVAGKPSSAQAPAAAAPASRSVAPGCTNPYYVRQGDTLSIIAQRCGVGSNDLKRWNRLSSNIIRIGQRLVTRGGAAVATPAPRSPLPQAPRAQQPVVPQPKLTNPAAPRPPSMNPVPTNTPPVPSIALPPPPPPQPRAPARPVPTEPIYPRLSP